MPRADRVKVKPVAVLTGFLSGRDKKLPLIFGRVCPEHYICNLN